MNTIKIKLKDGYDYLKWRIRHYRGNIRCYIDGLKRWFSYYKVLTSIYDFDYSSILEVEKHQITRVRDYISKHHTHVNWKQDVEAMNLALKLLSIAMEEDSIAKQVSGHCWVEGPDEHDLYEWKSDAKYEATKYVNISNAKRFSKLPLELYTNSDAKGLYLDSLRVEKAWNLYNKLRSYKMRSWWD